MSIKEYIDLWSKYAVVAISWVALGLAIFGGIVSLKVFAEWGIGWILDLGKKK